MISFARSAARAWRPQTAIDTGGFLAVSRRNGRQWPTPPGRSAPMNDRPLRVLCIEDVEDDCLLNIRTIQQSVTAIRWARVTTREAFLTAITKDEWDVVLSDHSLPEFSSVEARALLSALDIDLPFIIVSGTITEE